jgi:hypothetical protein
MPHEVRADPVELGRAARLALAESQALFEALRQARGELPMHPEVIGKTRRAFEVMAAYTALTESAGMAVERLIAVLEVDVDALYQTAFGYQQADLAAAEDLRRTYPNIPI